MHFIDIGNGKILDFDKVQTIAESEGEFGHSIIVYLWTNNYQKPGATISKEELNVILRLCPKKLVRFKNYQFQWEGCKYRYINVDKITLLIPHAPNGIPCSRGTCTFVEMENGDRFVLSNDKYKEIVKKMKDQNF